MLHLQVRLTILLLGLGFPGGSIFGEELELEPGKAYEHEESGLILPRELSSFALQAVAAYETKALGVSARYRAPDELQADVFLYNRGREEINKNPEHSEAEEELGRALDEVRAMENAGYYAEVEISDEGVESNFGKGDNTFHLIQVPLTYRPGPKLIGQADVSPGGKRKSIIAVGVCHDHFLKVRYTFPDWDAETNRVREVERDEFVEAVGKLVLESRLWPNVRKNCEAFRRAPDSEAAQKAGADVVLFAEASQLIAITVDPAYLPFLHKDDYEYSTELLVAYCVGNTAAQFESLEFRSQTLPGVEQMLDLYSTLKEKRGAAPIPGMEELRTARESGNLKKKLQEIEAKKNR